MLYRHAAYAEHSSFFHAVLGTPGSNNTMKLHPNPSPGQDGASQDSRGAEPQNGCRYWTSDWISSWLMTVVLDNVLVFRLFVLGKPGVDDS